MSGPRTMLVAAALLVASPVVAREEVTVELSMARGDGCFIAPDGAGLWSSLWDADTLYIEAEDAHKLTLQEGHEVLVDPDCGGGRCLARVARAVYAVPVTEAGRYRGWARALLPFPGSWGHHESMNGSAERLVRDSTAGIFGTWYWTPLGEYTLGPGENLLTIDWLGGAKLDALIFSADPEFDPTKLQGIPAGPDRLTGTLTSRPVLPSAVARWLPPRFEADLAGGTVTAEASPDGGATWLPADEVAQATVRGDGTDALMVRFTLAAAQAGASPTVTGASAGFRLAPDAEVALETDDYRIAVARQTGALAGILNRRTGTPATALHLQEPFVGIAVREPGAAEMRIIPPAQMQFEGLTEAPGRITLDFSAVQKQVRVRVELAAGAKALSDWTITIDNRSDLEVVRVDFPMLRNCAIDDFRDDEAIVPKTGGLRIARPATAKDYAVWYLGSASMSWMELCDAEAGLYVAMLDRNLTTTEMTCSAAAGNRGADLEMHCHHLVGPGQSSTRSYQVGVHSGDWHWAADRYREWALSWMQLPHTPEWVRWTDGWVGAMSTPFAHMPDLLAQARLQGIEYLQYWGQMADGIDQCCGNFYWPAPALGGAEGFRAGIEALHAAGGRVTGYMNCQTWTRDAPINDALRLTPRSALPQEALDLIHPLEWFERWRLCRIDGSALGYYARTRGWYIMCPASTGFQEHLRFWIADMYAKRFGADGVYIDQTGATAAKPCYNLEHGHSDIGAWGGGNVEMLRTSLADARAVNPDFTIAIEGCGDALGQFADLHLVSGLCTNPEVYHYTFPEHILISGLSNSSPLTLEQRISRAFLNGDRFDSRIGREGLNSALRLRRRIKRWLYPARFMDTVGLQVSDPQVLARWNVCDSEGERALVLTFDNEQQIAGATCALRLPDGWEQPDHLYVFDREGRIRAEKPQVADGVLSFEISPSTISAALATYAIAPDHAVDVVQEVLRQAASSDTLVLNAVNLLDRPVTATITPRAPTPLRCPGGPVEIAIPARGAARTELRIEGVDELLVPTPVTIEVSWPGGERESIAELQPLLLNPNLNIDQEGDGIPDYWIASGSKSIFQRGIEDGAAWIQGQEGQTLFFRQRVPVEPDTEYYFAADIRRSEGPGKVYAAVVEHIGERGLQVHGIGDDPGAPTDTWQRFETTFTTGPEFRAVAIYLYNIDSTRRAWFRNVELRPTGQ